MQRRRFLAAAVGWASIAATACHSSDPAHSLVEEAIDVLQREAYFADRVDWSDVRVKAGKMLQEGNAASDAIRFAIAQLHDGHSFYIGKQAADNLRSNVATDDFGIEHASHGRFAYLKVPHFAGSADVRMTAFANDLRRRIALLEREKPCGWVVDLRSNVGGNMGPMLSGLRPLLGEGVLGRFAGRQRSTEWRADELDRSVASGALVTVQVQDAPVAVLVGPDTKSSGEAVFVSFIGRARTRSFGQATAGKSSGNRGIRLSDGSMLLVMGALMEDRDGHVFGGPIMPDEVVSPSPEPDAALVAAHRWLAAAGECPDAK